MTGAEMHAFEKAMMDNPMLSDAVDGYRDAMQSTDVSSDLAELTTQIKAAPAKVVKGSFNQWIRIAAAFIVLLSAAVVLYRIFNEQMQESVVQQKETTVADTASTIATTTVDSATVAVNEVKLPPATLSSEPKPVIIPSVKTVKEQTTEDQKNITTNKKAKETIKDEIVTIESKPSPQPSKDNAIAKQEAVTKIASREQEYLRLNRFAGKIVDANNNPLPFANITEKTSGVGTYADVNGNFVLLSADTVLTVQTKSLGYTSTTSQIKSNISPKIILNDEPALANAPSAGVLYERNKNRNTIRASDTTSEEVEAVPYDGWGNYRLYVNNNMRSPYEDELKKRTQSARGEVELSFDVNPDGTLTNIKVERSNCSRCNSEAIRLLKEGPRWKSKSGRKEHTKFTVEF